MTRQRSISIIVAALVLSTAGLLSAQVQPEPTITDLRTSPSLNPQQNNPDNGAFDPNRAGTIGRSNRDVNTNRNPNPPGPAEVITETQPEPTAVPPEPLGAVTEPAPPAPLEAAPPAQAAPPPEELPRTGSSLPLQAALGGLALVAVGGLKLLERR